jgi:hypothetical protein
MAIFSLQRLESSIILSVLFWIEDWKLNTTYVSQITKVRTEFEHPKELPEWPPWLSDGVVLKREKWARVITKSPLALMAQQTAMFWPLSILVTPPTCLGLEDWWLEQGFHVLKSKLIDIEYKFRTQNARVSNHLLICHKTKVKTRILLSVVGLDFWHLVLYFSLRNTCGV